MIKILHFINLREILTKYYPFWAIAKTNVVESTRFLTSAAILVFYYSIRLYLILNKVN